MESIRSELARLKELETEIAQKFPWNNDTASPRGIVEEGASSPQEEQPQPPQQQQQRQDSTLLIQRYEQARDLYLKRRLENLLVDHIATYRPEDEEQPFDIPQLEEDEENALNERHTQALAILQTSLETVHDRVTELRMNQEKIKSRREELECMLADLEDNEDDDDDEDYDDDDTATAMDKDENVVDESAMASEQARIEELQKRKIQLQQDLAKVQAETQQAQERAQHKQARVEALQTPDQDAEEIRNKIEELKEMKDFYDRLREVMEELGGVKILKVEEESGERHLLLTLKFYNEYQVQVELEVYRKAFLKIVSAKWLSEPVVRPAKDNDGDSKKMDDFSLSMDPLDDLVQVAKTTLGPPHDLRFVVRETLARIRMAQDRVQELSVLRENVLTKFHSGNQVICSLNDGIVIVMRIYEKFLKLEQIVGVGGWDEKATSQLQTSVTFRLETELAQDDASVLLHGSKVTPMIIVQFVQEEIQRLQATPGWVPIKTPRCPERKGLSVDTTATGTNWKF